MGEAVILIVHDFHLKGQTNVAHVFNYVLKHIIYIIHNTFVKIYFKKFIQTLCVYQYRIYLNFHFYHFSPQRSNKCQLFMSLGPSNNINVKNKISVSNKISFSNKITVSNKIHVSNKIYFSYKIPVSNKFLVSIKIICLK